MAGNGPPDKFTNTVDVSGTPEQVLTAVSAAWAAYYATWKHYPNSWFVVGCILYYGGYAN
jgi:hypothetical protein